MLRRELLRAWLSTPMAGRLGRWFPLASGAADLEQPNAASIYRQAFGWSKGLTSEDRERLRGAETIAIDDPGVVALIRRGDDVLGALRRAASMPVCRWEKEVLSTEDLNRDRMDISNLVLVRLACLSARRKARTGRGREALDDLFAALAFAHRIGTGGVLFARIVEGAGEIPAFQTLGRILPGFDRATLDDLSRRLDALPPPEPAGAIAGPESRFILAVLRARIDEAGPTIAGEEWVRIGFDQENIPALEKLTGGDRARLLAHLDASGPAFAELARLLDLPRPGCRVALDQFAEAERSRHPIVASLVEHAWNIRHVIDRLLALRAMTRAAIALVRDGEAAFRIHADPYGSGPFHLEHRWIGHRIRSALDDGKLKVSLQIGDAS